MGADPHVKGDIPALEETRKALEPLKSGKTSGVFGIHPGMLRAGGRTSPSWLQFHVLRLGDRCRSC